MRNKFVVVHGQMERCIAYVQTRWYHREVGCDCRLDCFLQGMKWLYVGCTSFSACRFLPSWYIPSHPFLFSFTGFSNGSQSSCGSNNKYLNLSGPSPD